MTLKPSNGNATVPWIIPVAGERALDGAAMYLCLLGYPGDKEKRRETFKAALAYRARCYRARNKVAGRRVRGEAPDPCVQSLLDCWPVERMFGALSRLNKQVINRLRAAELFGYFGAVSFAKPTRHRQIGRYRVIERVEPRKVVTGPDGAVPTVELGLSPTTRAELVWIGAERWNTVPGNVRKTILGPAAPVMHMALALREMILAHRARALSTTGDDQAGDDLLTALLGCPQWVLPTIEDAQIVTRDWHSNAKSRPSWQSIDPSTFLEIRPTAT